MSPIAVERAQQPGTTLHAPAKVEASTLALPANTTSVGGGDDYESARVDNVFNRRRPAIYPKHIVRATSVDQVVQAVRYAAANKLKITIRSGGHSWAAWSLQEDSFLVDLSQLKQLDLNVQSKEATVSPSTTGIALNEALFPHGLMFNSGHCPDVGLGGFLLQGGQGWCCRDWGWSVEAVKSMRVVVASGEVVTASETENADLFWAARGSGPGFFGVVVSFTVAVRPLIKMYGSTYIFDAEPHYDQVAKWYLEACPRTPSDCELVMLAFRSERIMPHLQPPRPLILVRAVCFSNDEDHAKNALSLFAKEANTEDAHVAAFCQETSFAQEYERQAADNPIGRYFTQNAWLDGPLDKVAASMKPGFIGLPTKDSFAMHFSMAPLKPLTTDMAFDMQTEHTFSVYTIAPKDTDAMDEACRAYHASIFEPIDSKLPSEGGACGIYLGDSDLATRPVRFMSDAHWHRFCELRRKWDPLRLFAGYHHEPSDETKWNRNPWEM